jgi:putative ABC transport system permease protein
MNLIEILRQTIGAFRAHKMRIFLTMFGIVWGILSVILLVGLGRGFSADQKRRMQTLGKDLVIVWGGRTSSQVGGLAAGREVTLVVDDARLIQRECYLVKNVSPELRRTVVGIRPSYQDFRSLLLGEGRLITDEDERDSNRAVILGFAARRQLFPGQPAVGSNVLIKSVPYTVIGVLKEKKQSSNYDGPDNDYLFAPYSSVARDFPPPQKKGVVRGHLDNIVFEVADAENHDDALMQVRRSIGRVHHFDPKDKDTLFIWDTMEGAKMIAGIFQVITLSRSAWVGSL